MALLTDLIASNATAAASAGGIVKIASVTANNSATLTMSLPTSGYTYFKIAFDNFVNVQSSESVMAKIYGATSGGYYQTFGYHVRQTGTHHELAFNDNRGITIVKQAAVQTAKGASGELTILGSMASGFQPRGTLSMIMEYNSTTSSYSAAWKGPYSEVQDTIQIASTYGNMYSGTATLYGIK